MSASTGGPGPAWITSEWCSTWHLSGRAVRGPVIVSACGHPLTGRMSRVFDRPPPLDMREVCQACVAATSTEASDVRFPALEEALVVMGEHRSFRATAPPDPDPPIKWPETDPDAFGARANPHLRPMWTPPRTGHFPIPQAA